MERCLSHVMAAYMYTATYHHLGVMTKGVLCMYKVMVTVNDLMTIVMSNIGNKLRMIIRNVHFTKQQLKK